MIIVETPTKKIKADVVKSVHDRYHLIDIDYSDSFALKELVENNNILSISDVDIPIYSQLEKHDDYEDFLNVIPDTNLWNIVNSLSDLCELNEKKKISFAWRTPRNYILDSLIERLVDNGHTIICSGGNEDLPVLDMSPVAVDGVIRVGGGKYKENYHNWIDMYDCIIGTEPCADRATLMVAEKYPNMRFLRELDFYSDSKVRAAAWPRSTTQGGSMYQKYLFEPIPNLLYCSGEHIVPMRPGEQFTISTGSIPLLDLEWFEDIDLEPGMNIRGMMIDERCGYIHGTFKYKRNMAHRMVIKLLDQTFEYHMISFEADNVVSMDDAIAQYFDHDYDKPPFTIRTHGIAMRSVVKLLEPGDAYIRTYNLNDTHLYRGPYESD